MEEKFQRVFLVYLVLSVLVLMAVFVVEQYIKPAYFVKSGCKVLLFTSVMGAYMGHMKRSPKSVLRIEKVKNLWIYITLMTLSVLISIGGFMLIKNQIDLLSIKESLMTKEKLTKLNCIPVFTYIVFVNAFLEEMFFRGFLYHLLKTWNKVLSYIIPSVLFSLYHIGIFITWFHPFIFTLCLIGLMIVGVVLQFISVKAKSIFGSYLIHASANIVINGIGMLLLLNVIH